MNSVTRQLVSKLRALADHPATPHAEKENARIRIREILDRVRTEEEKSKYKNMSPSARNMAERISRKGINSFKSKIRAKPVVPDEEISHDAWPFGWKGPKVKIPNGEYEFSRGSNYIEFAWECPDCGKRITRREGKNRMLQVTGSRRSIQDYIARMRSGSRNQLCVECWRKWSDK